MDNEKSLIYREMEWQEAELISQIDATCYIKYVWRWNASKNIYELKNIDWTEHGLPNGLEWHFNRFQET